MNAELLSGYVSPEDCETALEVLDTTTPWVNRDAPRDECFMASDIVATPTYSYGKSAAIRHTYAASEMSPLVRNVMAGLNNRFLTRFNVCVLNRYASGKEHLGWHADDSPEQDPDHPIMVVSFGASRYIYVRENGFKGTVPDSNKFLLIPGSVFVMPPRYQETHQHKIPKHDQECGMRISLTYRKLDR